MTHENTLLSRRNEDHFPVWMSNFSMCQESIKDSVKWNVSGIQNNRNWDKRKKIERINKILNWEYNLDDKKELFLNSIYEFWKLVYEPICKINDEWSFEKYKEELLFNIDKNNDLDDKFSQKLRNEILNYFRDEWHSFELFKIISERITKFPDISDSKISLNLENEDITNPEFKEYIKKTFSNNESIKNQNISFELLEHTDIENDNKKIYIENLKFLNEEWFKISIDDLFSWHSTIEKVDWLIDNGISLTSVKIDMDIIHQWENHKDFQKIKDYLSFLKNKWINIIAEWIENKKHLEFAKSLGADYFQGYMMEDLF